jgi:pimeloyl-ACP methyl ester carboxylesterase
MRRQLFERAEASARLRENSRVPAVGRFRFLEAHPPAETASPHRRRGTLVLLHAFPLNARMWDSQLAFAGQGWHVIAPHVRGVDGAEADPPTDTLDDYVADLIDLLDALRIEEAVVCGLSMGGYLAFALLRRAPNYVRALVLADTKSEADTAQGLEARERMLALVSSKGPAAVAEEMIPRLLGPSTLAARPDVVQRVRELTVANSAVSIAGAIRALKSRPDSTPLLSSLRIPTLIIVGEEDAVTPPASAEDMHRRISTSELVRIPASGHLSSMEQPDAFNAAVARFLEHRI